MGRSADDASNRLAEARRDYREQLGHGRITRNTTLTELATELLREMGQDDNYTDGNIEDYRREIVVSTDPRANSATIKIDNSLGRLQIWQATPGALDRHLKRLVALGLRRKAKQHRIFLLARMQIAVRHGAMTPTRSTGSAPSLAAAFRPAARSRTTTHSRFTSQIRAWARGEAIPGTPAYTSGPACDWSVGWIVDVITGTGMRPHEVFALLLDDIDLDGSDPYLDITGALVETKGAGTGTGCANRPRSRTTDGAGSCSRSTSSSDPGNLQGPRGHRLPQPAALAVPGAQRLAAQPEQVRPHLAAARGENFALVTPRTFRKGAATAVDHAYGDPERAARQLGNTRAVAEAYYIDIPVHRYPRDRARQSGGSGALGAGPVGGENVRFLWDCAGTAQIATTRKPLRPQVGRGFLCRADRI